MGFANFVLISFAFLDSLKVDKESPKYIKSFNLSVWVGGLWETQGGLFKDKINWRQETSEMAQWEEIISKVVSMDTLVLSLRFQVHTIDSMNDIYRSRKISRMFHECHVKTPVCIHFWHMCCHKCKDSWKKHFRLCLLCF